MKKQNQELDSDVRVCMTNRKARHLYHIEKKWEAGIMLAGTEVKSLRQEAVRSSTAYAEIAEGEVWLNNLHIPPYEMGNRANVETKRRRKLLLKKNEIKKLTGSVAEKGHTLIPLRVYFRGKYVKVEIALVRGKKDFDKRQDIKERQSQRDMDREIKNLKR